MRGFSCYHYHNRKWKCALRRFIIEVFWKKYFLGEVLFFFLHSLSLSTIVSFFKNRKLMRNYHQGELILQLYDNMRIDFIIKRMDYNLYVVMQ